ncbi:hypothetical protein H6G33_10115 [Calothrix sp. FACHB-1219]|uniref:hypothetical protein n=1 Tax=unclassified Calothrix TaxID=2619626 RepID=UPI00168A0FCF|nr:MULTISPECIES: hypothetical protein [unclassified Calothrix]MBD2201702.1 hypothetical protein [Calothrix sp. FACHB-168]MBD2217388.1 hypothetical protein [Calothrix sp. FACHB-1219]
MSKLDQYLDLLQPQYLSREFIKSYENKKPPFGQLGAVIYIRTYSRFIEELRRRERWIETISRVIEYSLSLDTVTPFEEKQEEAKELFEMMFYLKGLPSGRSLWTAGSAQSRRDSSSNWNCTFRVMDSLSSFSEIYYWLLIGAGTGFSVEEKYITKLPKFYNNKQIDHEEYNCLYPYVKSDDLSIISADKEIRLGKEYLYLNDEEFRDKLSGLGSVVHIDIGDSKEAWCLTLRTLLTIFTIESIRRITFNYDLIRPEGTRIRTFGGRSSGPRALKELIDNILKIFNRFTEGSELLEFVLDSVGVLDILNAVGLNVKSGGTRRTAEIGLGSRLDKAFITAKENLWSDPKKEEWKVIRTMSNNSILYYENPGVEEIRRNLDYTQNGDPGVWIIGNSLKLAESPVAGTNPCAEAALDDKQSCNLTTQVVVNHVYHDWLIDSYQYDYEASERTIELITRIGCRQTLANQWHPEWDKTQKRDRLLGVSMTGIMDAADILGWGLKELEEFFKWAKKVSIEEANRYHDYLGINRSTRVTLLKPEGTLSLLPTVSSGIHRAYAPYFYRRVRFSKTDPLTKVLLDVGMVPVPENGQGDDLYAEECNTWIFTFPMKTNASIRAIDESAIAQLERYKVAQKYYADRGHNISITVTIEPREYDEVAQWLYDNWDDVIGIAFLSRFDPREGGQAAYPNMPNEPCTEEEYLELKSKTPELDELELLDLLTKYETDYEDYELDSDCLQGCPVK